MGIDRERDYCCVCVYSGVVSGRMTAVNGEREYKKEKQNTRNRQRRREGERDKERERVRECERLESRTRG